jgi:hypothetical protein
MDIVKKCLVFFGISVAGISFLAVSLVHAETLIVSIRSLPIKGNERIVGFTLDIRPARIITLTSIPRGWNITVDNDPSMNATVRGSSLVGAAALSPDFFSHFITIDRDETLDLKFDTRAQVVVTQDFKTERRIYLKFEDFTFTRTKPSGKDR